MVKLIALYKTPEDAAAFDVSAGCSGFLYALSLVDNAMRAGACKRALVVGAERLSAVVNWKGLPYPKGHKLMR